MAIRATHVSMSGKSAEAPRMRSIPCFILRFAEWQVSYS